MFSHGFCFNEALHVFVSRPHIPFFFGLVLKNKSLSLWSCFSKSGNVFVRPLPPIKCVFPFFFGYNKDVKGLYDKVSWLHLKVHHPSFRMGFVSMNLCMFLFLDYIFLSSLVSFLKIEVCPFGLIFPKAVMSFWDLCPWSKCVFPYFFGYKKDVEGFYDKVSWLH